MTHFLLTWCLMCCFHMLFNIKLHYIRQQHHFVSPLWSSSSSSLDVTLYLTMSYHPQSRSLEKRIHRSLKVSLHACLTWLNELPWVMLRLSYTPKLDLNTSPTELVFSHSPLLPGEFFIPQFPSVPPLALTMQHHSSRSPSSVSCLDCYLFFFLLEEILIVGPFRILIIFFLLCYIMAWQIFHCWHVCPCSILIDHLKPAVMPFDKPVLLIQVSSSLVLFKGGGSCTDVTASRFL